MTRYAFCEMVLRAVYADQPNDDSNITVNLVNSWLNQAIGIAAQKNYKENGNIEGIQFVNNSFYTVFRNLSITVYEQFVYQIVLPQIPFGLGRNEGVGTLQFVDVNGNVSDPAIPLSENQVGIFQSMRPIPNKTLYYSESINLYAITDLLLDIGYTAKVRMVSGGDFTDINSLLNVPDDYISIMMDFCIKMLRIERAQPKDLANDGEDVP